MVAIVDQQFARAHFPGEDPIGQGIDIGNGTDGFYEIVGVVGGVRQDSLERQPGPTMYVPFTQSAFSAMWVVVRTKGEPTALSAVGAADRTRDRSEPAGVCDDAR